MSAEEQLPLPLNDANVDVDATVRAATAEPASASAAMPDASDTAASEPPASAAAWSVEAPLASTPVPMPQPSEPALDADGAPVHASPSTLPAADDADCVVPEATVPRRDRRHFGMTDRVGSAVAAFLGVALLGLAVWHAPAPMQSSMDAVAAVPPSTASTAAAVLATPAEPETLWAAKPGDLLSVGSGTSSVLDARLMRVYGLIAKSDATTALDEARKLATEYPGYGLAQLVYADLLATSTSQPQHFVTPSESLSVSAADRLKELVAEARARVAAAGQRPAPGRVPAQFVRLDPKVKHAIAVDVSRSRVYVLENSASGLVVKRDYYASVGKLGMSKQVEGDLRTPLGVYFVTGRIPRSRLDERYGATALTLNYPNQYDQIKGRTGSGIWVHGIEPALFTRAPLATDGCVALSNPDLLDLAQFVERQSTPVLIAEHIDWVDAPAAVERHSPFLKTFEAWQRARQSADVAGLARFYANPDDRLTVGAATAVRKHQRQAASTDIGSVSMLSWNDQGNVMVVTYSEADLPGGRSRQKRQYWREEAGAWQVIFEGALS